MGHLNVTATTIKRFLHKMTRTGAGINHYQESTVWWSGYVLGGVGVGVCGVAVTKTSIFKSLSCHWYSNNWWPCDKNQARNTTTFSPA